MELVFGNPNKIHALISPRGQRTTRKAKIFGATSFPLFFPLNFADLEIIREGDHYQACFCLSTNDLSAFDGLSEVLSRKIVKEKDFFKGLRFDSTRPDMDGVGYLVDERHNPRISAVASVMYSNEKPNIPSPAREIYLGGYGSVMPRFDRDDSLDFCLNLRMFGRFVNIYVVSILENYASKNKDYSFPSRVRIRAGNQFLGTN
jgi:hypothetical protein